MVVFSSESGKALLLLREMHLPSRKTSQAIFLPKTRGLPVSTGFATLKFRQKHLKVPDELSLLFSLTLTYFDFILPIVFETHRIAKCLSYLITQLQQ